LKNLFEKRFFKLFQKLSGHGQSSRRALLRSRFARAHNGSYQILFVKSQRFKVFCQAFCKKLAAGGSRSPINPNLLVRRIDKTGKIGYNIRNDLFERMT